ncbi:MAG TPA: LapA family protein [Micavibrio sp.]|nr:LapA family protein [Micavibrio sp.]
MKDFLFTLLAWLFTLPCLAGAIVFALYNPDPVSVTYNPFKEPLLIPVYVPVLTAVAFGFLFGALMTWAAMGRLRAEKREQAKRIKTLEKEIQAANSNAIIPHNYALIPSSFLDKR